MGLGSRDPDECVSVPSPYCSPGVRGPGSLPSYFLSPVKSSNHQPFHFALSFTIAHMIGQRLHIDYVPDVYAEQDKI